MLADQSPILQFRHVKKLKSDTLNKMDKAQLINNQGNFTVK